MITKKRHPIVLVDDEKSILEMFETRFGKWHDVHCFRSAAEVLRSLDQIRPSVILIDWVMPEMDGITLCGEIRKLRRFDLVPIAIYTGMNPSVENMQKAFQAGAQSFISKGHSEHFVLAHINSLINSFERMSQYLWHRKIMLSVLKHDMSSLLTGVTTGVSVLSMHPAFESSDLRRDADTILEAGEKLRQLFGDLSEVLVTDSGDEKRALRSEKFTDIAADLREYLKNFVREIVFNTPKSLEFICNRRSLGRCLYYMVRFVDRHVPPEVPITVEADRDESGAVFMVSAPGRFKEFFESAVSDVEYSQSFESRHDVMFVQYIQNVLSLHKTRFSVIEQGKRTGIRFLLPELSDSGLAQA